jgi:hypothetical protein
MYSFAALAPDYGASSHMGFFIIMITSLILLLYAFVVEDDIDYMLPILVVLNILTAGISWNTGVDKEFKNEKVEATLVGFQSEGYNERSGKSRADYHYNYVIYKTPDGEVMFRSFSGNAYPKQAILYKN